MAYATFTSPDEAAFNDWADRVPGPHKNAMAALEVGRTIDVPTSSLRMGLAELMAPPPARPSVPAPSQGELMSYRSSLEDQAAGMKDYWRPASTSHVAQGARSPQSALDATAKIGDAFGSFADSLTGSHPTASPVAPSGSVNTRGLRYAWETLNNNPQVASAPGAAPQPYDPRTPHRPSLS